MTDSTGVPLGGLTKESGALIDAGTYEHVKIRRDHVHDYYLAADVDARLAALTRERDEARRLNAALRVDWAKDALAVKALTQQIQQLRDFCERERALIEARGKGGQSVGRSPCISPSVLKELEYILRWEPAARERTGD